MSAAFKIFERVDSVAEAYRLRGPCKAGHPVTLENTQHIGLAGYRCKECRRTIAREHARRKFGYCGGGKARGEQS